MTSADARSADQRPVINSVEREAVDCPKIDMNCLDATKILASTNRGTHVYDVRNLSKRVFTQKNHLGRTTHCMWSPQRDHVYASSSTDRHVSVMDMGEVDRFSLNDPNVLQQANIVASPDAVRPRRPHEGSQGLRLEQERQLHVRLERRRLHPRLEARRPSSRRATRSTSLHATLPPPTRPLTDPCSNLLNPLLTSPRPTRPPG